MKTKIALNEQGLPKECPKCESDDLCIDNVEGMECMQCGCWFETGTEGQILWARQSRPPDLDI